MIDKNQIIKLRKATMLGISKCREALIKAEGNFEKAIDILRKEGQKVANKRAGMEMHQGRIFTAIHSNKQLGIILSISCETDFAANSEQFKQTGEAIAQIALKHNIQNKETLLQAPLANQTVQDALVQLSGQVKENIALNEYQILHGNFVGHYVHTSKLAAIVVFNKSLPQHMDEIGKNVAMQVVVSDPIAIDTAQIPATAIEKEKEIIKEQLAKHNKPEHILAKMAEQKLKKYLNESSLLAQPFVKNEKETIATLLQKADANLKVTAFARMQVS